MNQKIVDAITTLRNGTEENAVKNGLALLEEIHQAMNSGNQFVLPVIMPEDAFEIDDVENPKIITLKTFFMKMNGFRRANTAI